jgi:hypothetical protein
MAQLPSTVGFPARQMSHVQTGVSMREIRRSEPFYTAGTRLESTTDIPFVPVTEGEDRDQPIEPGPVIGLRLRAHKADRRVPPPFDPPTSSSSEVMPVRDLSVISSHP